MPDRWFMARVDYIPGHFDPTALVLHQYNTAIVAYGLIPSDLIRVVKHLPSLNELGLLITGKKHNKDEFGFLMFNEMIVCAGPGLISAFDSIGIPIGYDIDIGELLKHVAEFESLYEIAFRFRTVKKAKRSEARRLSNEVSRRCEDLLASCGKSLPPFLPVTLLGVMLNMMLKTDLSENLPYLILMAIGRLKPDFMPEDVSDELSRLGMEFEWLFPGAEEPEHFGLLLRRKPRSRLTLIDAADLLFDKSVFFTLTVDELSDVLNLPPDRVSSSLKGYRVVERGFVEALLSYAH